MQAISSHSSIVVSSAAPADPNLDGKKEACKTYIEQTKLLVTLASAFIFAPAVLIPLFKDCRVREPRASTALSVNPLVTSTSVRFEIEVFTSRRRNSPLTTSKTYCPRSS